MHFKDQQHDVNIDSPQFLSRWKCVCNVKPSFCKSVLSTQDGGGGGRGVDIDKKWERVWPWEYLCFFSFKIHADKFLSPHGEVESRTFSFWSGLTFSHSLSIRGRPHYIVFIPEKDHCANILAWWFPCNFPEWKGLSWVLLWVHLGDFQIWCLRKSTGNLEDGIWVVLLHICLSEWLW